MEQGYPLRLATKFVDAVFAIWKKALAAGDRQIEMPIGCLKVKKTSEKRLKRRQVARKIGNRELGRFVIWTAYKDEYRIVWHGREKLIAELNPDWKTTPTVAPPSAVPVHPRNAHPPGIAHVPLRPGANSLTVPSRTRPFRR
jgi:hypothetical protein